MGEPARIAPHPTRSVQVRVGGHEYRLRTDQDEPLTLKAAELVNERLAEARKSPAAPSEAEAVVLAALNLAGELIELRRGRETERSELSRRIDALLSKLSDLK